LEVAGLFSAWGDESGSDEQADPGVYLLGAAVVEAAHLEEVRTRMAAARLPGERKVHWRSSSHKRREELVEILANLPLEGLVVVRRGPLGERDERRRRKCFEHFAPAVEALGCTRLTLESRGLKADARDRAAFDALRARRALTGPMHLEHAPGPGEPLLWVGDILCGAVVADRTGAPGFFRSIASRTSVTTLDA
jgi:hypothetical protein